MSWKYKFALFPSGKSYVYLQSVGVGASLLLIFSSAGVVVVPWVTPELKSHFDFGESRELKIFKGDISSAKKYVLCSLDKVSEATLNESTFRLWADYDHEQMVITCNGSNILLIDHSGVYRIKNYVTHPNGVAVDETGRIRVLRYSW